MTYTFETLVEAIHDQLAAANETIADERSTDHPSLTVASVDVTIPFAVETGDASDEGRKEDEKGAGDDERDDADARNDTDANQTPGDATCESDLVVVPGRGGGELTVSFRPSARRVAPDTERPTVPDRSPSPDSTPESSMVDVSRVEGIGPVTREQLRAAGFPSLGALADADPGQVADVLGVSHERAASFVAAAGLQGLGADAQTAELLAARGVDRTTVADLDAGSAVDEVDAALADRAGEVPADYVPDVRRLDALVRRARTGRSA